MTISHTHTRTAAIPRGWFIVALALVAWGFAIGCAWQITQAFVAALTIIGG